MKLSLVTQVERGGLLRAVPPRYRDQIPMLEDELFNVMVFEGERSAPVTSGTVSRALRKLDAIGNHGRLMALGPNFTQEAQALLKSHDAVYLTLMDFFWTDTTWARVRGSVP